MEIEPRRARRIRHTRRIATKRHSDFIHRMLDGDPSGSRWASTSPHFWAKVSIGSCRCRKRHRGAPRRDKGMCDHGARRRVYQLRAQARDLEVLVCRRGMHPDSDEVALLDAHLAF